MKNIFKVGLACTLIGLHSAQAAFWHNGQDHRDRLVNKDLKNLSPKAYVNVAKANANAVVNIRVEKLVSNGQGNIKSFGPNLNQEFFEKFFGFKNPQEMPKQEQRGLGSGFVISEQGYVVTNNHVVKGANRVVVIFSDEKEYEAKVIGQDAKTDLALLKITDQKRKFPAVVLGDSDQLEVGDVVVAIGNPFGLSHTTTQGIVSAKERSIGISEYDDLIQTDASINPGNSGGPLLNIHGEVVGINTAIIASGQGLGFAIPINMAKTILLSLKETGKVERAWLGVQIQQLTQDHVKAMRLKSNQGALIAEVIKGSPAEKAGLKAGDVVVKFGNKTIEKWTQLSAVVATSSTNKKITMKIIRDGRVVFPKVKLEKRKEDLKPQSSVEKSVKQGYDALGLVVEPLNKGAKEKGLKIVKVKPNSQAFKEGLRKGDIILQLNQQNMTSTEKYAKLIKDIRPGDYILMRVQKQQRALFIAFRFEGEKD
ncbi:Do family serine endopeptidase [bacterium]|nr:Do family serine endopeptidase [bacterium]